jgi:hypothetical protein
MKVGIGRFILGEFQLELISSEPKLQARPGGFGTIEYVANLEESDFSVDFDSYKDFFIGNKVILRFRKEDSKLNRIDANVNEEFTDDILPILIEKYGPSEPNKLFVKPIYGKLITCPLGKIKIILTQVRNTFDGGDFKPLTCASFRMRLYPSSYRTSSRENHLQNSTLNKQQ